MSGRHGHVSAILIALGGVLALVVAMWVLNRESLVALGHFETQVVRVESDRGDEHVFVFSDPKAGRLVGVVVSVPASLFIPDESEFREMAARLSELVGRTQGVQLVPLPAPDARTADRWSSRVIDPHLFWMRFGGDSVAHGEYFTDWRGGRGDPEGLFHASETTLSFQGSLWTWIRAHIAKALLPRMELAIVAQVPANSGRPRAIQVLRGSPVPVPNIVLRNP